MWELAVNPRIVEPKDWATGLFFLSFALVVLAKTVFETRFAEFLRLLVSDKYIKIYRDSSNMMSGFTLLLFVVQLLSFSFFIQLLLHYFGYHDKTDWISFLRVFTFFSVFVLSKYLVEKIIGVIFNVEEFVEQYNLQKVSYRTFIGLLVLPFTIYLFYHDEPSNVLLFGLLGVILIMNLYTYLISLKIYQNLLIGNLFYFILYLCALEIAPYYFIYYLITKI